MAKPVQCIVLLVLACLFAGLFGALHSQLSYSVGPSYFHDLKFAQFGIEDEQRNRIGAALVGWRSSWWMGLLAGVPLIGLAAVLIPQKHMMPLGLGAIFLVVFCGLVGTLAGLLIGLLGPNVPMVEEMLSRFSEDLGFLRAALMHEGSFWGGAFGGIAALWMIWRARRNLNA